MSLSIDHDEFFALWV